MTMQQAIAFCPALIVMFGLSACTDDAPFARQAGPYAPGIARNTPAVDGLLVGDRLMEAGEFELALEAYIRAAADKGLNADTLAALGSANLGLGRLNQAEDLLRRAIATDKAPPEAWNNLGVVLMEQGNTAEAEQVFRRAYALDNGESDAIRDNLRLALAKMETSDYDAPQEADYKLVRRGRSEYLIRKIP